ncbi:MAG: AFG1 family ATPase [Hyphomicrobiaceae bacterium]|nr:AFG1 family ATPase [Hyphomicrobiaceae bacterium]
MVKRPLERYRELVGAGGIEPDPAQHEAAGKLDALALALAERRPRRGLLALFSSTAPPGPKGLYIHGAVGRGKTMLMDLFHAGVAFEPKRRVHFHEFMADVHERIAVARRTDPGDPIPAVARRIAAEARLLCFDELHVTDIADAMILGRLFKVLFESGVVVVATSNAAPGDLYRNGLNRQLFLPFVDLIEDHMEALELAAAKDFRLEKLNGQRLYFTPADAAAHAELDRIWLRLTGSGSGQRGDLQVKGRMVRVPQAAMGVARFGFGDLCEKPLGALDYLHIARTFHTLLIERIPVLGPQRRNEARRFINLIDTLYDNRVCLVATADAEPDHLYVRGDGADLFERTASRLMEMRSETYLADRNSRRARASSAVE